MMGYVNGFLTLLTQNWPWILSVLIPFIVAAIARTNWSAAAKGWLAVGLSVIVGGVGAYVTLGTPSPEAVATFALTAVGFMQVAYRIFRSFGITSAWLDGLLALGSGDGA